jgi:ATP-dependent DNA ligase
MEPKLPQAKYQGYKCPEDYERAGVLYLAPMTCYEIEDAEEQEIAFQSADYFIEEKIDGTRGCLQFFKDGARLFSRRVSAKTGWFAENSDSVPHIRDLALPGLEGTVLDGELYIPGRPFKDVAGTLNCLWDEAVRRQERIGKIVLRAFDIRYYRGARLESMPLHSRKRYLRRAVEALGSPYIVENPFFDKECALSAVEAEKAMAAASSAALAASCATLRREVLSWGKGRRFRREYATLSKKAYYEFIVASGGEGVILKKKDGKYFEKRCREFQKIKKFITREAIVTGFSEASKAYEGKFPNGFWPYWIKQRDGRDVGSPIKVEGTPAQKLLDGGFLPVTRYWHDGMIGTIAFGVAISDAELEKMPARKRALAVAREMYIGERPGPDPVTVIEVGECSGFDDATRAELTRLLRKEAKRESERFGKPWIKSPLVVEVKANEVFKDTGRLRHPRFLRVRPDADAGECVWADHVHSSEIYLPE